MAMHRGLKAVVLAIAVALACASAGAAEAASKISHHRHTLVYGGYVGAMQPGAVYTSRGHYTALVGDPGGGLGFYPLPYQYRVGAWRYSMRTPPLPPWITPNPVIAAAQAQSVRYYGWGDPTPASDYRYGVYNPIDGVGSPFFAGYYGPAGDGDEDDDSGFPFGHPYGP
jgi:hypothetical protein